MLVASLFAATNIPQAVRGMQRNKTRKKLITLSLSSEHADQLGRNYSTQYLVGVAQLQQQQQQLLRCCSCRCCWASFIIFYYIFFIIFSFLPLHINSVACSTHFLSLSSSLTLSLALCALSASILHKLSTQNYQKLYALLGSSRQRGDSWSSHCDKAQIATEIERQGARARAR